MQTQINADMINLIFIFIFAGLNLKLGNFVKNKVSLINLSKLITETLQDCSQYFFSSLELNTELYSKMTYNCCLSNCGNI